MKAVLRQNLIALSASIKKVERSYTISLRDHLKALDQKEANILKRSKQQEIINLMDEINDVETKRTIQKLTKLGSGSLRKSSR